MNKKYFPLILFVFICIGAAFIQYKNSLPIKKEIVINMITAKHGVTIDGQKKEASVKIKMGSTALQLLSSTHKIISKGEKQNAFITTIDERAALTEKREFWAFYVNGKQAVVGAGSYIVKNNDTIEWKIETY